MRAECQALAAGQSSILRTPFESFDLDRFVTSVAEFSPNLCAFLRTLMDSGRPSREAKLSEQRKRIKETIPQ